MSARGLGMLFGFALLVGGQSALASEVFPPELKNELGLAAAPPCTLCHQSDLGGTGTATKRFAVSLKRYGVRGLNDLAALDAGLAELEKRGVDSDGDGVGDIAELVGGDDPNVAAPPPIDEGGAGGENGAGGAAAVPPQRDLPPEIPMLETGCAVSATSQRGSSALVAALMTFAVVSLRRRRGQRASGVLGKLRRCPTERA